MTVHISPKVLVPAAVQILAGVALWVITNDPSYLIVTLTGLSTGALGAAAPPAKGVKQHEVKPALKPFGLTGKMAVLHSGPTLTEQDLKAVDDLLGKRLSGALGRSVGGGE